MIINKDIRLLLTVISLTGLLSCGKGDDAKMTSNVKPNISLNEYAMQKEKVNIEIVNSNLFDAETALHIDFGDGEEYTGKVKDLVTHAYTNTLEEGEYKEYNVKITVGDVATEKKITVYNLLAIPEMMKMWDDKTCRKVLVMTHRAHVEEKKTTENSISAVERSIASGADIIETDTQITLDGVVVISHDDDLNINTNAPSGKKITQLTYDEVLKYNLKYRDGTISDEKVPTLEQFLLAGRGKIYYNLDYSPRSASTTQVMRVVQKVGMNGQVFYYCNSEEKVKEVFDFDYNANPYCWSSSQYMERVMETDSERRFMVQLDGYPSSNVSQWMSSRQKGYIVSTNLLKVNHWNELDEWSINQSYVDPILNSGCVQVIHTDAPRELVKYLESKGRR